jgi:hypothetical protein
VSTLLEELALEGRLGVAHWRILVYLWQRHLAGDESSTLKALGYARNSLARFTEHLQMRGLVCELPEGGRYAFTPTARIGFSLPVTPGTSPAGTAQPDGRHPFVRRDKETQRLALAAWWDSELRRDLAKVAAQHWRSGTLPSCPKETLDIAERHAIALPKLFEDHEG